MKKRKNLRKTALVREQTCISSSLRLLYYEVIATHSPTWWGNHPVCLLRRHGTLCAFSIQHLKGAAYTGLLSPKAVSC